MKKYAVNIHGYLCFLRDLGNSDEIAAMKTLQLARPEVIAALVPAMLDSRPQRRIIAMCLRRGSRLNPAMPLGSERCIGPMISFNLPSSLRLGGKIGEAGAIETQITEFIETYTVRTLAIILYCDDVVSLLRSGEMLDAFFDMSDRFFVRLKNIDERYGKSDIPVCFLFLCDFKVCIDVYSLVREAHRIVHDHEVDIETIRHDDSPASLASLYGILFVAAYRHLEHMGKIAAYSDLESSLEQDGKIYSSCRCDEKNSGNTHCERTTCASDRKESTTAKNTEREESIRVGEKIKMDDAQDTQEQEQDIQDEENADSAQEKQYKHRGSVHIEKYEARGEEYMHCDVHECANIDVTSHYLCAAMRAYKEELDRNRTPSITMWNFTFGVAQKIHGNTTLVKKITAAKAGMLAAQLHNQKIRDRVILYAVHPTIRSVASLSSAQLIRKMTEASSLPPNMPRAHSVINVLAFLGMCVPAAIPIVYGTMAYIQWWVGEGSKARASIDKISESGHDISLVKLVEYALSVQLPPPWVDIQKEE